MPLEIPANKITSFCPVDWKMVFLISRIERFDELWPSLSEKVHDIVSEWITPNEHNIYDLSKELEDCPESLLDFTELTYWYETETEIPPLISCLLFIWYLQIIPHFQKCGKQLAIEKGIQLLIENGYTWVYYIPISDLLKIGHCQHLKIGEWILAALSILRKGQKDITDKLDSNRLAWKLIASEELLLHIIKHNPRIRTTAIGKKLGVSISTVKKMLNNLIQNRKIERNGTGRGTHYRVL
jgi:hypothetical protein